MLENYLPVAGSIESLICTEMRRPYFQGVIEPLARAAREKQGGVPPVLLAAQKLKENVGKGDVVIIATGLYVEDVMPAGEGDGPPGCGALAFALNQALGAVGYVIAEPECLPPTRASLSAVGLVERPLAAARHLTRSVMTGTFPCDGRPNAGEAEAEAERLIAVLNPKAIVVIEKIGLNAKGIAHRGGGKKCMDGRMRIEVLTEKARAQGIPTIAIGDLGNEAGVGLVADECREHWRWGATCQCDCEGGIAVAEVADVTVIAQVSNWGAYGIAALLGMMVNNEEVLHSREAERQMILACLRAGAVDGITIGHDYSVDGIDGDIHCHIIDMLHAMMHMSLAYP